MKLMLVAGVGIALVLLGAFCAYAALPLRLPDPSGPHPVASRPFPLTADRADPTPIARLWYPGDGGTALPVLVYLPSWTGTSVEDRFLIGELVSRGYVVLSLRWPTATEVADAARDGRGLVPEAAGDMDFSSDAAFKASLDLADRKVRARARTVSLALDALTRLNQDPAGGFAHRLDLDQIGAWGFSLGGAGAAEAARHDPRIKAVANLDGWLFADAATDGVPCRYFLVGDGEGLPPADDLTALEPARRNGAILDRGDYDRQLAGLARHGGYMITIDGTSHLNFADVAVRSRLRRLAGTGSIDPRRGLVVTGAYLVGFFDAVLRGRPSPLLAAPSPLYPEVHLQVFSGDGRS